MINLQNKHSDFSIFEAVKRKRAISNSSTLDCCYCSAIEYLHALKSQTFRGIVFDYDLTLHNKHKETEVENSIFTILNQYLSKGIQIGIATGNGEYIAQEIRIKIHSDYWNNVIMGYYNGGFIIPLGFNKSFSDLQASPPEDFKKMINFIDNYIPKGKICSDGIVDNNPFQLNFFSDEDDGTFYVDLLKKYIREHTVLKILQSPHSFDVVPTCSSKLNVCNYMCQNGLNPHEILTIGDSGNYGGNDYELLNRKYSLSVDQVSGSIDNCWNFSPCNIQNLDATLFYLEKLHLIGNGLIFF